MIRNIALDWGLVLAYPTTGNWFVTPHTIELLGVERIQKLLSDNWPSFHEKMRVTGVDQIIPKKDTVMSCDYNICKTDVKLFEIARDKWNIDPAESLFIDDNIGNLENSERVGYIPMLMDRAGEVTECRYPIVHGLSDVMDFYVTNHENSGNL